MADHREVKAPNLFIVGAPKCGTTTMFEYLKGHPQVFMPSKIKEPNFFSADELIEQNLYYSEYSNGQFGGSGIISDYQNYIDLFLGAMQYPVVGEASVSYLFYPGAPSKIYRFNPDSKIIIMLRNPIDRAYSHYLMDYNFGHFDNSFNEVINGHSSSILRGAFQQAVSIGKYYDQVKRYLDIFPRENVLILYQEEIGEDVLKAQESICTFLGIELFGVEGKNSRYQVFKRPRNRLFEIVLRNMKLKSLFFRLGPPNALKKFLKSVLTKPANKTPMTEQARAQLFDIYQDDVFQLGKLVNKDLGLIWSDFRFEHSISQSIRDLHDEA